MVGVVRPHPRSERQRACRVDRHRVIVRVDRRGERNGSAALVFLPEVDQPGERRFGERRPA